MNAQDCCRNAATECVGHVLEKDEVCPLQSLGHVLKIAALKIASAEEAA